MKIFNYILFTIAIFCVVCSHSFYDTEWEAFKSKYSKVYSMLEEDYRYQIFIDNLQLIEQYQREDPDAHYGITKFADLTPEEFQRYYLGLNTSEATSVPPLDFIEKLSLPDIPDSLDWRQLGAVTVPKAQAICGSCWAFSAAANIEGQYFLKQNMLRNFSETLLTKDVMVAICKTPLHGFHKMEALNQKKIIPILEFKALVRLTLQCRLCKSKAI